MKKLLFSVLFLFITFSCEVKTKPKQELIFSHQISDSFKINGKFVNYDDDLTFGFIYKFNPTLEEVEDFKYSEGVIKTNVRLNKNQSFSYTFNDDDLSTYHYIVPLLVRGYVEDDKGDITYTKETFKGVIYNLALNIRYEYARSIVADVESLDVFYKDINIDPQISEMDKGYIISSTFNNLKEGDVFGYIYKHDPYFHEYDEFSLKNNNLNYYLNDDITNNEMALLIADVDKNNYYDDITVRAFIYNEIERTITFSNFILTTSLYDLAIDEEDLFSRSVRNTVNRHITIIDEIVINTDVDREYEVHSYTKGLEVSMYFDYYIVRLTVNTLKGYKISDALLKENIVIKIVMDGIIVEEFTYEVSKNQIIIIYDDYGWGPPM